MRSASGGLEPVKAMIAQLPVAAVWELERALTCSLRPAASPAQERIAELGALARLLRAHGSRGAADPFSTVARGSYDRERPSGAPSGRRLVERYGSWRKACRAADGLLPDGRSTGPGKPWRSHAGAGPARVYSDADLVDAVRACAASLRRRPSSSDYYRWWRARRAYLRRVGSAQRMPSLTVITARLGGWRAALAAAAISDADLARWRTKTGAPPGDVGEPRDAHGPPPRRLTPAQATVPAAPWRPAARRSCRCRSRRRWRWRMPVRCRWTGWLVAAPNEGLRCPLTPASTAPASPSFAVPGVCLRHRCASACGCRSVRTVSCSADA